MKLKLVIIFFSYLFLSGCITSQERIDNNKQSIVYTTTTNDQLRCSDGTLSGTCSYQRPYYCQNGRIVKKASKCGCSVNEIRENDNCISAFEITPMEQTFTYTLRGQDGAIKLTVYKELNDFLSKLSRSFYCDPTCPSETELELRYLDRPEQKGYLNKLVELIKQKTNNKEDQARIAISLVQHIPYAYTELRKNAITGRYPYEVLYDNQGVCSEKSRLLAFLLRELGFGTALFVFNAENHMTVGIRCYTAYQYRNTEYCFIETTEPAIITYEPTTYADIGSLVSNPDVLEISVGNIFTGADEEYYDAREWGKIVDEYGPVLNEDMYDKWKQLMTKYGLIG